MNMSNSTSVSSDTVNKLWDSFLSQVPLGSVVVWGENILSSIWPEFATLKQEVLYFIAYAEAESQTQQDSSGQTKKQNVVTWVMSEVDKAVPMSGFFKGIVSSIVSSLIDNLVSYLNEHYSGWEKQVMDLLSPSTTASTPTSSN